MAMLSCSRSSLTNNFNEDWISGKRSSEIIEPEVSIRKTRLEAGNSSLCDLSPGYQLSAMFAVHSMVQVPIRSA